VLGLLPFFARLRSSVLGTTASFVGAVETLAASLRAIASLGGAMTVVSAMLFPLVWND
jgi:hypothetical protein